MVPEDFQALSQRRADRARDLADRYAGSREVLTFCRELFLFQIEISPRIQGPESVHKFRERLIEIVSDRGPEGLRQAAAGFDDNACREALRDYWTQPDGSLPVSFFARVLLQPYAATADLEPAPSLSERCARCGHRPQVGVLRPAGHGSAFHLVCSLCLGEWSFPRGRCPACSETTAGRLAFYSTPDFGHVQVLACETCRMYLHMVDLGRDPAAVPDVDELTALPLDLWAQEKGYRKLQPNLAGI